MWQKEFEDSFIYEETADQLKAIQEIKEDMESSKPMDRLICGDVGFENRSSHESCFQGSYVWLSGCSSCPYHYPCCTTL